MVDFGKIYILLSVDNLYMISYTTFAMNNLMPISDVRAHLPDIVAKVDKYMERVIITVKGQPKATLISAEELESLEETAEILAIPNILKDIKKSEKQIKEGKIVRLEDIDK